MAKTKFSKKGKGGKTLQTPEEKKNAMSHKGEKKPDMERAANGQG